MKRSKRDNRNVYRSLALFTQFGLHMLVPICMMSALGIYLDRKLGTSWFMILLFFVGTVAGGQNVFRLARQISGGGKRVSHSGDKAAGAGAENKTAKESGTERKKKIGQSAVSSENDK